MDQTGSNREGLMLITLRELKDNYDWEKVCKVLHINPWCINEGADDDSTWHVTMHEAEQIGIMGLTRKSGNE